MLDEPASDEWLQDFAAEMNYSETAYLQELPEEAEADFHLRWFTPRYEVDLCGHATLASAHQLWDASNGHTNSQSKSELKFQTRSGILKARRLEDDVIELNFPSTPPKPSPPMPDLLEALAPDSSSQLRDDISFAGKTCFDSFLQLNSSAAVHKLSPDFAALGKVPTRGIIVTAQASDEERNEGIDFVSRFFAPTAGVHEDPVTGSAHCALAPFWFEQLSKPKSELVGYQASERGGMVRVALKAEERVLLRGRAFTVVHGALTTTPN